MHTSASLLPADLMLTNTGESVGALSRKQPVMLVFLRHFGCTFCREALADIAGRRADIEAGGTQLIFVHMSPPDVAERYFQRYDLPGVRHVSDPDCRFYREYGLVKGNFRQLFGLQSWIRGFNAGVVQGHGVGTQQLGDGFQMPGIFVVQAGEVRESYIHKLASDRPDYEGLARCCALPS